MAVAICAQPYGFLSTMIWLMFEQFKTLPPSYQIFSLVSLAIAILLLIRFISWLVIPRLSNWRFGAVAEAVAKVDYTVIRGSIGNIQRFESPVVLGPKLIKSAPGRAIKAVKFINP